MGQASDVERLRSIIARRLGLQVDDAKLGWLDELFNKRVQSIGKTRADCLTLLDEPTRGQAERRALAQDLTVSETFFFRQNEQLLLLSEVLSEEARVSHVPSIRILSAGCASGEEPYSLAILLKERLAGLPCELSIRGVDMSIAALDRARRGRFSAWSLRETPDDVARRYFTREGDEHVLDPAIRSAVKLEERNLIEDHRDLFAPSSYDAVLCRNVLMYFTREAAQLTVARIARALVPGGYLVLGYAETLRGLSQAFHLKHTHGTFYYQRRADVDVSVVANELGYSEVVSAAAPAPAAPSTDTTWFAAIAQSTERVRALAEPAQSPLVQPPAPPAQIQAAVAPPLPTPAAPDLAPALELMRKERYGDALDQLDDASSSTHRDPDALLLRAALLTHSGQLDRALSACRELLVLDELNAGAHHLIALCYEGQADAERAREHDQIAVYLDPTFAMARLHLGLAARRAGDRVTARRELEEALTLLQREETARLVMFAGGFERAALIALCRSELLGCGGVP